MLPQPPAIVNAITFHLVFSIRSFHHAMISNGSKVRLFIVHDNGTDCDMRKKVSVFDYLFFFSFNSILQRVYLRLLSILISIRINPQQDSLSSCFSDFVKVENSKEGRIRNREFFILVDNK